MATPAFAAESGFSEGEEGDDATAAITKIFHMADGTVTPAETFTFTFTMKEVNGVTTNLAGKMPPVSSKQVSYTAADTLAAVDGMISMPREAEDIFAGVDWPHAGVYIYTVKETEGSNAKIAYSKAEYDIHVYVANGENGGLYVAGISAYRIKNDEGTAETPAKVDPTPGEDSEYPYSQIIFNNTYVNTSGGGDPADPDNHALDINKTVTGTYGDKTKYFEFTLTMDKASTLDENVKYEAYVMAENEDGDLKNVTSTKNYNPLKNNATYGLYIEVTTGDPIVIYLQHGQKLVFTNLHYGTSYIVTESADANYKASVTVVADGNALTPLVNADFGQPRSTAPNDTPAFKHVVGENENSASFTNLYKQIIPTGISVDNLPYILMIAVALGALAGYVIVKNRRDRKSER